MTTASNSKASVWHLTPVDLVLVCEKMLCGEELRQIEEHCADCAVCRQRFDRFSDLGPDDKAREILSPVFSAARLLQEIQRENEQCAAAVLTKITRPALPRRSGGDPGPAIPPEKLQDLGLPKNTEVVCHSRAEGYEIYLEASVPLTLTLEFYKGEEFLYRATITRKTPPPDSYIPHDAIEGWTEVRVLREQSTK